MAEKPEGEPLAITQSSPIPVDQNKSSAQVAQNNEEMDVVMSTCENRSNEVEDDSKKSTRCDATAGERVEGDLISAEEASNNSLKENEEDNEEKAKPVAEVADFSSMQKSLFSWTSRVRKSSAQFAADAAQHASVLASAAKEKAAAHLPDDMPPESDLAKLFIQSSSGAYLPLNIPSKSSETKLTNNSLVVVRRSVTLPCPPSGYSYQWYKARPLARVWVALPGATQCTLQPSAVDAGYRLRCIVSIAPDDEESDLSDDECSVDAGQKVFCQTRDVVSADGPMFSGTQSALGRGAQFGGILGRGNAEGRRFRLKVEKKTMRENQDGPSFVGAGITIYQVVGDVAEPMHDEEKPILCVSAVTDYSNGKYLELTFQRGIPKSASMIQALATDERFQIALPNRLGRESLLLALGIANFSGKSSDLSKSTPLYESEPPPSRKLSFDSSIGEDSLEGDSESSTASPEGEEKEDEGPPVRRESLPSAIALQHVGSIDSRQIDLMSQSASETEHSLDLEHQVQALRAKLLRREKLISDLQRHAAQTEAKLSKSEAKSEGFEKQVETLRTTRQQLQTSLCQTEKRLETQNDTLQRLKSDHKRHTEEMEAKLQSGKETINDMERRVKALENERAVMCAAVEARDAKLGRMSKLQVSYDSLSGKLDQQELVAAQLEESQRRCSVLSDKVAKVEKDLQNAKTQIDTSEQRLVEAENQRKALEKQRDSYRSELESRQLVVQKCKAERNNYKQKGDSLAKEMAKVCKNGRTIREVEKIVADDAARRQEVSLLREQKRKALEECERYRTAHQQSRAAQKVAGVDQDQVRLLERNSELERLLSELTEYVSAKEMQLETLKQVNEALQIEIGRASKLAMSKNLKENDV